MKIAIVISSIILYLMIGNIFFGFHVERDRSLSNCIVPFVFFWPFIMVVFLICWVEKTTHEFGRKLGGKK